MAKNPKETPAQKAQWKKCWKEFNQRVDRMAAEDPELALAFLEMVLKRFEFQALAEARKKARP